MQSLCEDINNVWYYWDNKCGCMVDYCYYDERKANLYCQLGREYLNEVFPHKYEKEKLSLDLISNVSGTFYTNVYEPIQNVPYEYEHWCKQEKSFQKCTFFTIGLSLITLFVILMLRDLVPLCVMNALTISNMVLLALSLYMFSMLMKLARGIFR